MLRLRELELGALTTLLCDADGNLFPSEKPAFEASVQVTNDFLTSIEVARRFAADELRLAATGKNFQMIISGLATEHGVALAAAEVESWVAQENAAVTEHLERQLRPDARVTSPVQRLSRSYSLAVVSSSALSRLAVCFEVTGLAELFPPESRFSAQSSLATPTSKPDPAVYLHAGQRLGIAPSEGLAVEDAVAGAQSALAAGFQTVGNVMFVPPDERTARVSALSEAGVAAIVESWDELEVLIGSGVDTQKVAQA